VPRAADPCAEKIRCPLRAVREATLKATTKTSTASPLRTGEPSTPATTVVIGGSLTPVTTKVIGIPLKVAVVPESSTLEL
jgi:hypothetical protein